MPNLNLSALSQATNVAGSLSGLALVVPQLRQEQVGILPQAKNQQDAKIFGNPESFFFHIRGEEIMDLVADITDHYVEDNTAIADQIALRPDEFKVQGFIGDVNDVVPRPLEAARVIAERLVLIDGYVPGLSVTALRAYNAAEQAYRTARQISNAAIQTFASIGSTDVSVNVITGSETPEELAQLRDRRKNQNQQQIAFQQFYGYMKTQTLFTVQTPWAIFQNMAIKSLRAVQDAESVEITDFTITFKAMRFAETQVTSSPQFSSQNMQGRASQMSSGQVDIGVSTPRTAEDISLGSILGTA
jgi:hypothetical protein